MLGPGHRIADRLADCLDDPGDPETPAPGLDIDLELDRPEQRLQLRRAHSRVHPPHGGHLVRLLAGQDVYQGIALSSIGALIDDDLHRAVTFMHGTGQLTSMTVRSPSSRTAPN